MQLDGMRQHLEEELASKVQYVGLTFKGAVALFQPMRSIRTLYTWATTGMVSYLSFFYLRFKVCGLVVTKVFRKVINDNF
jgi:hypothetical protein